jgi:hypothetical protein
MNSILAEAQGKKLPAKKTRKSTTPPSPGSVTGATTNSDTRNEGMDETAAQAVAVVATKLAKIVAEGHGGSKDAKAFAKEIVEVDKDEPFLPTEVNVTANLSVIIRLWGKLFKDGNNTMPPDAKKGVITKFVKSLPNEDLVLVLNAAVKRMKNEDRKNLRELIGTLNPEESTIVSPAIPRKGPAAADLQDDNEKKAA